MKNFVGIDLGTTNSAICSYGNEGIRIWKSPEQNDVTPSAIYIDRRGNRYYGRRAYEMAPSNNKNSATLFKRFMGTSKKFVFEDTNESLSPEECSAEILKLLYGYLPEEIRNNPETATVVTVPAAFNQVKKDATLEACSMAGLKKVSLMQEPVAAVMSILSSKQEEGIFIVYDLGGGTFDISIAENIGGRVNLLTQGGKEMCGGRDWDRLIMNNIIVPWLRENFSLPDDFIALDEYKMLQGLAIFAAEQAKVELSVTSEAVIRMDEGRIRCTDLNGDEVYLDIDVSRNDLNNLISDMVYDTIEISRETLDKVGLSSSDINRIVFVGGPTNYKPLRDKVSDELAIPTNINVNPMTAVAEGASIFAESIDWNDKGHNRKKSNAQAVIMEDIKLNYKSRVAGNEARIAFLGKNIEGKLVTITSLETGWTSGNRYLHEGEIVVIPIESNGENTFEIRVVDKSGREIKLNESRITIIKTLAAVDSIPASHSIAIKALDRIGGNPMPIYLVEKDEILPNKGQITLRAGEIVKSGTNDTLSFSLWEGDIIDPIEDNRFIGTYKITGTSFSDGIIKINDEIICSYEISESGNIHLGVSVPSIGADFGDSNFYSRQGGTINLDDLDKIANLAESLIKRIEALNEKIYDPKLIKAREKAQKALYVNIEDIGEEGVQSAHNELLEAQKLLARSRDEHITQIKQIDLDFCKKFFNSRVRQFAIESEADSFDNLVINAQRFIENGAMGFENLLTEMWKKNSSILWRQDWFVIDWFNSMIENPAEYSDISKFESLKQMGKEVLANDKINELRGIISQLRDLRIQNVTGEDMLERVNVIRG